LCSRKCLIREGERGFCQARECRGGELLTHNYGFSGALGLDPVEKKPLYHFMPGTLTFSVGAPGCDFDCLGCQNHNLSRPGPGWETRGQGVSPEDLVGEALRSGAKSLSFTYSEPTVFFEYAQDTAILGKENGLPSVWVTNGFFSPECLEELGGVAAMNIDLKGFTEGFYREVTGGRLAPVMDNIRRVREKGLWLEVTTLLIPGLNDSASELREMAAFIASVSLDTPWHLSRFHPLRRQSHLEMTSVELLLRARDIGKEAGLRHVYLGNVSGPGWADTLCPACGAALVEREGFGVARNRLAGGGRCPDCGEPIAGVW
jgi:pyruvate formate lyase activating enzyme